MEISSVGVAGLGLLGRGIAACLLANKVPVIAFARSQEEFAEARLFIAQAMEEMILHANFDPTLKDTWRSNFTEVPSASGLARCDFVIESIIEDAEAKIALFAELEEVLSPTTPIASNTSSLPISLLQKDRRHPERFLGMHWAIPAHATRFLELIRGNLTDDACMESASDLALRIGKDPCIVQQDIPGFIANRLGYAMYREACHLLASGVGDADTIDRAFRNSFGLWASICGPFQWIDLTGGPALYGKAMSGVLPTLSNAAEVPEPLATMMRSNDTGIRSGRGFYQYTPEEAKLLEEAYRTHVWRIRAIHEEAFPLKPRSE
jgi:3-hydroxybutyryl-CoA dehydrogenase